MSLRSCQLGNTLAKDGYDKLDASNTAVAVQETPQHKGSQGRWTSFQNHYALSTQNDPTWWT